MKTQWNKIRRWGKETAKKFRISSEKDVERILESDGITSIMILVFITCESTEQAEDIGRKLLKKRLAGCVNIIPGMRSLYFWPPGKKYIEEADEVILLCKTIERHYKAIEIEVLKLHSYSNPAIFALPITHMSKKYADWMTSELA
ncbi:divalent-cation tolerance protein CutA [Candidatus Gottesmanbacteria bacterium]|nr:divalent-cation tolerance protein CutA [Candidatus Gottesmanbacteria bacterium]